MAGNELIISVSLRPPIVSDTQRYPKNFTELRFKTFLSGMFIAEQHNARYHSDFINSRYRSLIITPFFKLKNSNAYYVSGIKEIAGIFNDIGLQRCNTCNVDVTSYSVPG